MPRKVKLPEQFDDMKAFSLEDVFAGSVTTKSKQDAASVYRFNTPPNASWQKLHLKFTANDVLNAQYGEQQERLEPEALGLRNKKNNKPKQAWVMLRGFALSDGVISKRNLNPAHEKQVESLHKLLQQTFEIEDNPIVSVKGSFEYQCCFKITAGPGVSGYEP